MEKLVSTLGGYWYFREVWESLTYWEVWGIMWLGLLCMQFIVDIPGGGIWFGLIAMAVICTIAPILGRIPVPFLKDR